MSHQKHLNPFYIDQGNTNSWDDYYDEDDDEEELGLLVGRGQYEPQQDPYSARRNPPHHYNSPTWHAANPQKLCRRRVFLIGGLSILFLLVLLSLGGESQSETNPSPENELKNNTDTTPTHAAISAPTPTPTTNTNTNNPHDEESPLLPEDLENNSKISHNQTQPIHGNDNHPKGEQTSLDPDTITPTTVSSSDTSISSQDEPDDIDAALVTDNGTIDFEPKEDDDQDSLLSNSTAP